MRNITKSPQSLNSPNIVQKFQSKVSSETKDKLLTVIPCKIQK
jgi:hypothetical protein